MNNLPTVTKNILIINVLCFLAMFVGRRYGIDLNDVLGLHFVLADNFSPYQFVTYMFMHANFEHIFFNMFAVWMFGRTLESVWGPRRFLAFYLICGVGAGLTQELVQMVDYAVNLSHYDAVNTLTGVIPMKQYLNFFNTVGASGAVYAILMGFGVLYPNAELFIIPFPFPIKAKYFVTFYILIELYMGIFSTADGVAHFAHLGGMIFGYIMIKYWKKKDGYGGFGY